LELAALHGEGLEARVGVESGEVAVDGSLVAGRVLTLAGEAARQAAAGSVVAGASAAGLLQHAATFAPGSTQLRAVAAEAPPFERRLDAPLVGRRGELRTLRRAFDAATAQDACTALRVVGPAGIGKTRLARELADAVRE